MKKASCPEALFLPAQTALLISSWDFLLLFFLLLFFSRLFNVRAWGMGYSRNLSLSLPHLLSFVPLLLGTKHNAVLIYLITKQGRDLHGEKRLCTLKRLSTMVVSITVKLAQVSPSFERLV